MGRVGEGRWPQMPVSRHKTRQPIYTGDVARIVRDWFGSQEWANSCSDLAQSTYLQGKAVSRGSASSVRWTQVFSVRFRVRYKQKYRVGLGMTA